MVESNLFLCVLLSALAGLFTIVGKVVVLHLARRRKALLLSQGKNIEKVTPKSKATSDLPEAVHDDNSSSLPPSHKQETLLILSVFVVTQFLANGFMFVAPWYGAVSIYWPCYIASQLLANMLIVGTLLQHERFEKPAQIATLMVAAAVLYITLCGPSDDFRDEASLDITKLLEENWMGQTWLGVLSIVFVGSFGFMLHVVFRKACGQRCRKSTTTSSTAEETDTVVSSSSTSACSPAVFEIILLLVSTSCSALSATASKAASTLPRDSEARASLMSVTWLIILAWSVENYIEGRYVRSLGRFLPCMTLGSILLNALTGLLVWQDATVVTSWAGYATALALLAMGVYLISDLDFFQAQLEEQQEYLQATTPMDGDIMSYWLSLFGDLEQDLREAQVQECLPRHQQQMRDSSRRFGGLVRGNSDPELGTRTKSTEHDLVSWRNNNTNEASSSLRRPQSGSSYGSLVSFASSSGASSSVTSRTTPRRKSSQSSLQRMSASLEQIRSALAVNHSNIVGASQRTTAEDAFMSSEQGLPSPSSQSSIQSNRSFFFDEGDVERFDAPLDTAATSLVGMEESSSPKMVIVDLQGMLSNNHHPESRCMVDPPPPPSMASPMRPRTPKRPLRRNGSFSRPSRSGGGPPTRAAPLSRSTSTESLPLEGLAEADNEDDGDEDEDDAHNNNIMATPPPSLRRRVTPQEVLAAFDPLSQKNNVPEEEESSS